MPVFLNPRVRLLERARMPGLRTDHRELPGEARDEGFVDDRASSRHLAPPIVS